MPPGPERSAPMIGRVLSHYRVVEEIDRGGMGIVYRAVDTTLDREVALKVLPPDVVADASRQAAFLREAKAVARLKHPHIAVVYEVGEDEGSIFMALELVEGGTLKQRLEAGPLDLDDALSLGADVADALACAHEHGIVHRDVKPDNVLLDAGGHAKVIDFGLAKLTAPEQEEAAEASTRSRDDTFTGKLAGTLSYMSPEQASGRAVDSKSDVFSFGILLFELVCGRRPFGGASALETVSAILKDPTPPVDRPGTPRAVAELIEACLVKEVSRRQDTLAEAASILRAVDGDPPKGVLPVAAADEVAVAVLPFTDMSVAQDQDYFCQGMAEEVIGALATIDGLRVAARTSTFRFRGGTHDVRDIGRMLGVSHLLEGSVRTSGSRLRVTVQLIKVSDGYQMWSEKFDRRLDDVFEVQDEIAARIVDALQAELGGGHALTRTKRHTDNLEAYHLYLKARHRWSRRLRGDLADARRFFEQAVAIDPTYSAAHAGLADVYTLSGAYGFLPPDEARAGARRAIAQAIEIAPDLPDVRRANGFFLAYYEWDLDASDREYRKAMELDPENPIAHSWLGISLAVRRRFGEALAAGRRGVALDPLSEYAHVALAWGALLAGEPEQAQQACRKALEIVPDYALALAVLGLASIRRSPADEDGIQALREAATASGRAPIYLGWQGWGEATAGATRTAREIVSELESVASSGYVSPLYSAWVHAGLGELDRAFEGIERAIVEREPQMLYLDHPQYDPLRSDVRFAELRPRLGLEA